MAAKAKEYEFPLLNDADILTELAQILPDYSASQLNISDLKKPTAIKWQKFYIDILCVVFHLQVKTGDKLDKLNHNYIATFFSIGLLYDLEISRRSNLPC